MGAAANSDYQRVARAIEYIGREFRSQPGLAEVARELGLSEFHVQRLFRRWAGISPKRFLQAVTATHARSLLEGSHTVLAAAHGVGLSGSGRLHDLLIATEGVTPGELRRAGEGLTIDHGVHDTPLGPCLLAASPRGIVRLVFLAERDGACVDAELRALQDAWPAATLRRRPRRVADLAARVFSGARQAGGEPLRLLLKGTNFQIQVWRALLRIPPGRVVSYGDVAAAIGRPRAVRAVASAIAVNDVAVLIPCHRVLRKSGGLGGYRWGVTRKRALLVREAMTVPAGARPGAAGATG